MTSRNIYIGDKNSRPLYVCPGISKFCNFKIYYRSACAFKTFYTFKNHWKMKFVIQTPQKK